MPAADPHAPPGSVYALTAPPPPAAPPVEGTLHTDVLIIGAGITGLSAALHLAQAGHSVRVLDTRAIGWGASGRNGGQVNPGLKPAPSAVRRHYGPALGDRLVAAAWAAPDLVFDLIETHGLACEARRGGTLRAATAPAQAIALKALMMECAALGRDVTWCDAPAMHATAGTPYVAGMLDRSGGQINPLAYTREIARVAAGFGAGLHGNARVAGLRRSGGRWQASTPTGTVLADRVVFATNGYADGLWDRLRRSVVPVFSAIVASAPLPDALRAEILHQGSVLYELGHITTYYRVDAQGRLLFGGRSNLAPADGPDAFPALIARARQLWPALADHPFTHGWNGQVAVTTDHLPHWHEPMPGIFAALGYNGRGVAMATLLGRELARRLGGATADDMLLPPTDLHPIPLHVGWKLAASAKLIEGQIRDHFGL